MSEKKLRSYLISAGNSSKGPVGFCARVRALSKEEAVEKLSAVIPEFVELRSFLDLEESDDIDYFNVYFNENHITVQDIEDGETEDVDDDEIEEVGDGR